MSTTGLLETITGLTELLIIGGRTLLVICGSKVLVVAKVPKVVDS